MKKWIRAHRVGVFYLWSSVGAAMLAANVLMPSEGRELYDTFGLVTYFLFWELAGAILIMGGASLGVKRAADQFYHFCDPEPLFLWAEEEITYWSHSRFREKQKNYVDVYRLRQVEALTALGRYSQAQAIHNGMDPRVMGTQSRVVYYAASATLYLNLGKYSQAEEAQKQVQNLLEQDKKLKPFVREDVWEINQLILSIANGETQGVHENLTALLDKTETEYIRVILHCTLGKLYIQEKRYEKAREHLEYVAAHGNKLYARTEAEELLRTLPQR